jgi:hypothetical protein
VIFPTGLAFMGRIVRAGPAQPDVQEETIESGRSSRPVTALPGSEEL